MGWFSPIKGHYPSLGQIDKTLPVKSGVTGIERGMVVAMEADSVSKEGVFALPENVTADSLLYIALQDFDDAQAGMAGTVPFDGADPSYTGVTPNVPTITGLSLDQEGEYETDQFDPNGISENDPIGTKLTVVNGKFTKATGGAVVVAYLTGAPAYRWINNAAAKAVGNGRRDVVRQGAQVSVIRFRTK